MDPATTTTPSSDTFSAAIRSCDSSALLHLIQTHPNNDTLGEIVDAFYNAAISDPTNVDKMASALVAARDSPDAPTMISSKDSSGKPVEANLAYTINRDLYDMINSGFGDHSNNTSLSTDNMLLVIAMISGACARTKLCDSANQAGMVTCGLHVRGTDHKLYIKKEEYQIHAIHALIQILVGGKVSWTQGALSTWQNELVDAIDAMSQKKIITSVGGMNLLNTAKRQIGSGFEHDLTAAQVWELLFPA